MQTHQNKGDKKIIRMFITPGVSMTVFWNLDGNRELQIYFDRMVNIRDCIAVVTLPARIKIHLKGGPLADENIIRRRKYPGTNSDVQVPLL